MSNEITITNMDLISGDNAILACALIAKGYKVSHVDGDLTHIDPAYTERVEFWSYRWQTTLRVSKGRILVKSKDSAGWYYMDEEEIPEDLEPHIGDIQDPNNNFHIKRD